MASWHPSRRLLAAGLALSLAVHFGVGFVAKVTPVAGAVGPAPEAEPVEMAFIVLPEEAPPEPERLEPERVELGLERSEADTDAWLGFEEATEHEAPQSEVEQSALTPLVAGGQPGAGVPEPVVMSASQQRDGPDRETEAESQSPSSPPPADSQPAEAMAAAPTPEINPAAVDLDPPARAGLDEETPLLVQAGEAAVLELARLIEMLAPSETPSPAPPADVTDARALPAETQPAAEAAQTPAPGQPEPPRSAPDEPRPPAPPEPASQTRPNSEDSQPISIPAGANAAPGEGGLHPGEKNPSEASAASLRTPVDVRPGRVAAAQGLQITTVRPVFDLATLALARPRSPTLVIEFGKDGAVRRARFLPGRTTGEAGVDQPLLDAVYRWTAKGEALERLADEGDQTVSITMRIILR